MNGYGLVLVSGEVVGKVKLTLDQVIQQAPLDLLDNNDNIIKKWHIEGMTLVQYKAHNAPILRTC